MLILVFRHKETSSSQFIEILKVKATSLKGDSKQGVVCKVKQPKLNLSSCFKFRILVQNAMQTEMEVTQLT